MTKATLATSGMLCKLSVGLETPLPETLINTWKECNPPLLVGGKMKKYMLAVPEPYKPEPYKSYRNRTFDKYENRVKNIATNIKQCSLKPEDKKRLVAKLHEHLGELK